MGMRRGQVSPADKSLKRPARETRSRRKTLLPLFRFPYYPYVIYSKDKNLCISQTILFGIKMGFAKLGLGLNHYTRLLSIFLALVDPVISHYTFYKTYGFWKWWDAFKIFHILGTCIICSHRKGDITEMS